MKAALLYKPYDIRLEEIEKPKVGPKDILVVPHTGVCGTDINRYKGLLEGEQVVYPYVLGHEFTGIVDEVGKQVSNFQIGDKVYGIKYGSFSQYHLVPIDRAYKLPKDANLVDATSVTAVMMTLRAIKKVGHLVGRDIVIIGPGHAGLLLTQWAKIMGAERIIVTGTRENRLKIARDLGANITINTREEDPVQKVKEYTDGVGPDAVIEATGRPEAVVQAVEMVKTDGSIVIFGVAQEPVEKFDTFKIYRKRISMLGTMGNTEDERAPAMRYLLSGKISVKPIITHVLPLKEIKRGLEMVDNRLEDVIRMVIKPS